MIRAERGREAITHWERHEVFPGADGTPVAALVACHLETGRTHQIRVHMAHIGHPLVGDGVYGAGFRTKAARLGPSARPVVEAFPRQALHAQTLGFAHPRTGESMRFESRWPADFAGLVAALRG